MRWRPGQDHTGGAHDAPPEPLVGWGGDTPPQSLHLSVPLAPRFSRLQRSALVAPQMKILATPLLLINAATYVIPQDQCRVYSTVMHQTVTVNRTW